MSMFVYSRDTIYYQQVMRQGSKNPIYCTFEFFSSFDHFNNNNTRKFMALNTSMSPLLSLCDYDALTAFIHLFIWLFFFCTCLVLFRVTKKKSRDNRDVCLLLLNKQGSWSGQGQVGLGTNTNSQTGSRFCGLKNWKLNLHSQLPNHAHNISVGSLCLQGAADKFEV